MRRLIDWLYDHEPTWSQVFWWSIGVSAVYLGMVTLLNAW